MDWGAAVGHCHEDMGQICLRAYGKPLPEYARQELRQTWERLQFAKAQIKEFEQLQAARIKAQATASARQIEQLMPAMVLHIV